jgi:hypothetical protein
MFKAIYFKPKIEAPRTKMRGIFQARKLSIFVVRSLTPQSRLGVTGNALAVPVQENFYRING